MATYFWVGGSGTWDASVTTNWSATSGGAGGAGVPNNTDTALFDALSGTGVVSVEATAVSATTTVNNSGIELNLTGSPTLCVVGNNLNFTSGILTLNTFTLTCGRFLSSNANPRTINFGTGSINITGNGTTVWTISIATNLTITGTSKVDFTYAGSAATRTITTPGTNFNESNALNYNISAGTDVVAGLQYVKSLNFTGFSGTLTNNSRTVFGDLTFSSGMTITSNNNNTTFVATSGVQTLTTNGQLINNPINQNNPGATLEIQGNVTLVDTRRFTLTAGTLSLNNFVLSCGNFVSNNNNVRSIAFGTGNITVTGNATDVLNLTNGTNFSFTGSRNVFATYAGSTGTRTFSGWLSSFADETNTVNLFVTGGTDIVNLRYNFLSADLTGFAGTLQNTVPAGFWQNLTIPSGVTHIPDVSNSFFAFMCPAAATITTNGMTFNCPINFGFNVVKTVTTGTYSFQDALNQDAAYATTIIGGTVQLKNGVTSTVGSFVANNSNVKFLQSTTLGSQATLSQASGTVNVVDLNIRDINAVGGASWNAYTDFENVDAGNNDGWNFSLSPPYSTAELPVTLRPFTQPRRF
jgi:hypothetical protein